MPCRARNKNKISKNKYFRISLLVLLMVVAFFYVWQISQVSTQGYHLKDLERQVATLEKTSERLESEAAKLRSLSYIESKVVELGMVKNNTIVYLSNEPDTVAFKQ